jgi:hypothetical protein
MPYKEVNKPVPATVAFQSTDDAAILSQAAILLILGAQLRGDNALYTARAQTFGGKVPVGPNPADDLAQLGVPPMPASPGRIDAQRIRGGIESRYALRAGTMLTQAEGTPVAEKVLLDVSGRFFREPTPLAAAELMETSLQHPHELVRVSAAASYFDRSSEPNRLLAILEQGTRSEDHLTRDVAATALANIAPENIALKEILTAKGRGSAHGAASHTTVLVAGTWALNSPWWKPEGDFNAYSTGTLPPLPRTAPLPPTPPWSTPYAAADYYSWSGGYSDAARALGAQDLVTWVNGHAAQGLDLVTHSHGGNVAMLATQPGLAITSREMVLLSCPVHFPKYEPDFSKVQKIVSVRVHLDLVILADRGGQRFSDPRIHENVLPVWFDHFATHDPQVWTKYNVAAML